MTPSADYYPAPLSKKPSVVKDSQKLGEYWPAGHSWLVLLVLRPDPENVIKQQLSQPSVFDVALVKVDYCPAGQ